jgi:magnesium transporter
VESREKVVYFTHLKKRGGINNLSPFLAFGGVSAERPALLSQVSSGKLNRVTAWSMPFHRLWWGRPSPAESQRTLAYVCLSKYYALERQEGGLMIKEALNQSGRLWVLSEILGRSVVAPEGKVLGRILDLAADVREHDPQVTGLIISGSRGSRHFLPWGWVEELLPGTVKAKLGAGDCLCPVERPTGEILLRKALLDKQIVDTAGAKVVRVNDLHLQQRNNLLFLAKVDVGLNGLLRRVGLQRVAAAVLKWLFGYSLTDNLINWRLVQPAGPSDILRLRFSQARLARLHPADLADVLEDLDRPERARVFRTLDIDMAADVLEESDPKVQVELIQNLSAEKASDVLEQMSPSKATDLLQELAGPQVQTLLEEMEPEVAEDVRSLLAHDEERAGGIMTTSFFSQPPEVTVEQTLEALRREASHLDVIYYTYVVDLDGHMLGAVNLRELLTGNPKATLESIMARRVLFVSLEAKKSEIAELFAKYGLRAMPVVDQDGRIRGVIRFKALLEVLAPHLGR